MHKNYRRKDRYRFVSKYRSLPCRYTREAQRFAWKKARQRVRLALLHGEYDSIHGVYKRHIRWDYW